MAERVCPTWIGYFLLNPLRKLFVDDNFHYMDDSHRFKHGDFESMELAVSAAKSIVDDFLNSTIHKAKDADELLKIYKQFGEDPFIIGSDDANSFSAWDYAEQRCREMFNRKT